MQAKLHKNLHKKLVKNLCVLLNTVTYFQEIALFLHNNFFDS